MIRIIDHEGNGYGAQAEITRKKGVNGEKSLTGTIYTNEEVLHGVDRGWKLEFENEMYAFTFALPKDLGNQIELEFDAVHEFFYDMSKNSQNDLLSDGSHTFKAYLDFIFKGTGYNYRLDVDVQAFEKQNFGQKNRLDLFYDVIDTAGVEFSVNGSVVRIVERVGNDLSTVVKKGFNLNELQLEKNIGNFVTYQKGFGAWKDEEDHSKGRLEVEYLSPLAEIYGKLDADPVVDERYTVRSNLLARLQNNVEGSYQISVQIDMEDLTRAGYEYKQPHEGDSIMAINNDLGFQRKVRIVSYETDFDVEGNILDHRITCNSVGMVEQSILSNNSIKNSIKELQTDLELTRKEVIEINVSADGKSTNYYGPIEPSPDDYKLRIGDTWFDSSGEDTIVKVWNGVEWRKSGADVDAIRREVEQAQADIAEAQATADEAANEIEIAVENAGFTTLDETISDVQSISNAAQANAEIARDHALDALGDADTAMTDAKSALNGIDQLESTVSDINFDIDEINGTLDLKADSQTVDALDGTVTDLSTDVSIIAGELSAKADSSLVDTISGIVDTHTLDIQANAEGLAVKADSSRVDTLEGTVSSLGAEFDVIAGQVSSRVWNTDIETAIGGLEYENRNLVTKDSYRNWADASNAIGGSSNWKSFYIKAEPNQTYSLSRTSKTNSRFRIYFLEDEPELGMSLNGKRYGIFDDDLKVEGFKTKSDTKWMFVYLDNANNEIPNIKLERGTKATDWTPAPEDTLARFDHIETEWTQTFERFDQTVSDIDGRVTAQTQEIDRITRTIQEVTEDVEGNTTKINQTVSTVDAHTQTIANIETDLDGKVETTEYNTLVSTVDSTIRRIGDAEGNITQVEESIEGVQTIVAGKADQSEVTQLSNQYSVVVSDLTDLETDTEAQFSVLSNQINLRVKEGDVLGQINIEAGTTLIQNDKLYLDAQTVVFSGNAFIPGAYIKDASIDNAKIANATITSGKIASLDVNKISGLTSEFVQSYWNSATGGSVRATGDGILTTASDSSQTYIQNGIVGTRNPSGATIGQIGYAYNDGRPWYSIQATLGSHFQIRMSRGEGSLNKQAFYIMSGGYESYINTDYIYMNPAQYMTVQGRLNVQGQLNMENNDITSVEKLRFRYGSWIYDDYRNSNLIIVGGSNLRFYTQGASSGGSQEAMRIDSTYGYMYRNLSMEGYRITNQSDERLKRDITNTTINSLEAIKSWRFVGYNWKNEEMNSRLGRQFGIIAQNTPELALYNAESDTWNVNSSKQIMMNSHGLQQLAIQHENTLEIASAAYIAVEDHETRIKKLEKENKELRNEIEELKGAA